MCGIFGIVSPDGRDLDSDLARLFVLSESRGREAAGLALVDKGEITILKEAYSASRMMSRPLYRRFLHKTMASNERRPITAIGHSRLVTNGLDAIAANNQPVVRGALIGIHNGIIVNDAELWERFALKRTAEVDTEIFLALMEKFRRDGSSLGEAASKAFLEIQGTASVAIMAADDARLMIGTNNGSLHVMREPNTGPFYFASERHILRTFLNQKYGGHRDYEEAIETIRPGTILLVDTLTRAVQYIGVRDHKAHSQSAQPLPRTPSRVLNLADRLDPRRARLRRCTKCIMPETMPFIEFDDHGVCNYCRTYVHHQPMGLEKLRGLAAKFRRDDGRPDSLIAVSGGRDSCYGLHILKAELGLNPVAYTYDWGLITDLARRNTARLCGKLGIEHILVSADIRRKREHVRKNVQAWLKRPSLGMIPLFMAGDKQYFYYAAKTRARLGVELSFLCENKLERAHFKSGFTGVNEGHNRVFNIGLRGKMRLLAYYGKEYALNPRYINRSLFDTIWAFHASYLSHHREVQLYDYAPWFEDELVQTLVDEYDWERSPDTTSTWRIGDGTAPFYNYIYYVVTGFTEHDAFRSNQIREGVLDRSSALRLVEQENEPRWDSMRWYANTIGFSLNDALQVISSMPRLYGENAVSSGSDNHGKLRLGNLEENVPKLPLSERNAI